MTNEQLFGAFKDHFTELHAKVDALPAGGARTRAKRLLFVFHVAGNALAEHCQDEGEITTYDGTAKPNP